MDLKVHLSQRLLHMLNMTGSGFDQVVSVSEQGPNSTNVLSRAKRAPQQSNRMEPLAILNIRFPAGNVFNMPGVNQDNIKSIGVHNLEYRNPVYAGGLHGDGFNAALFEPLSGLV